MTWRIIVVNKTSKIDLKLNYLVIRGDGLKKVHLSEISVLLIENTAVSMTAALLCELSKRKIKIIFCDEKRNPYGELMSYYGSHDSTEKLRIQMNWDSNISKAVWTEIIKRKISKQREVLLKYGHSEANKLSDYIDEIKFYDSSNREGHAAKVYFHALFGKDFSRNMDTPINACLNYGYSVFLSAINREISSSGYFTQLGIFHDNMFNSFNLGSDLMEPFRPLVDDCVLSMDPKKLETDEKKILLEILNKEVVIDNKKNYLNNAFRIYCKSIFDAINEKNLKLLRFHEYEA